MSSAIRGSLLLCTLLGLCLHASCSRMLLQNQEAAASMAELSSTAHQQSQRQEHRSEHGSGGESFAAFIANDEYIWNSADLDDAQLNYERLQEERQAVLEAAAATVAAAAAAQTQAAVAANGDAATSDAVSGVTSKASDSARQIRAAAAVAFERKLARVVDAGDLIFDQQEESEQLAFAAKLAARQRQAGPAAVLQAQITAAMAGLQALQTVNRVNSDIGSSGNIELQLSMMQIIADLQARQQALAAAAIDAGSSLQA